MLMGSILAATDPVAVVAILEDIGAPQRIKILVEGESLLNDGLAIFVYQILINFVLVSFMHFHRFRHLALFYS